MKVRHLVQQLAPEERTPAHRDGTTSAFLSMQQKQTYSIYLAGCTMFPHIPAPI